MKAYIMLADGFEEIEALAVADVLRRGDVDTKIVSIKSDKIVTSARNVLVVSDTTLEKIVLEAEDVIVLPGGEKGVSNLESSEPLINALKEHQSRNGLLAAICAAPTIPGKLGFYKGVRATCYPGLEKNLLEAVYCNDNVVVDKNFITSKAAGTSLDFAYAIISLIKGQETAEKIKAAMLYNEK